MIMEVVLFLGKLKRQILLNFKHPLEPKAVMSKVSNASQTEDTPSVQDLGSVGVSSLFQVFKTATELLYF